MAQKRSIGSIGLEVKKDYLSSKSPKSKKSHANRHAKMNQNFVGN